MSAASIYAKRKTTNDLNDGNFADQIQSFRNNKGETNTVQKQQMAQQQEQYNKIRLPQERLMKNGPTMALEGKPAAPPGQPMVNSSKFSAFRSAPSASQQELYAQAIQKQRAEQQQLQERQRLANENRFELFYSRSCPQSRQQAEHTLEALETYFPVDFIRQHMVAIDFDNEKLVGPVHEAILKNKEYLAIIRVDCILYDKFQNSIIIPSQKVNLQVILKNYCRSMAPKPVSPPPSAAAGKPPAQTQQPAQHAVEQAPQSRAVQTPTIRAPIYDADGNLVAAPPHANSAGVSALAKHVGADINSPNAEVKLKGGLPSKSNALMLAETQDGVDQLVQQSDVAAMYSKNRGVTLGFGQDMSAITREFVDRHNSGNPLEREISSSTQTKKSKKLLQVNPAIGRSKAEFQPQHLQGIAESPFTEEEPQQQVQQPPKQRRLPLPAAAPSSAPNQSEHEQLGKISQIKCKK